MYKNKKGAFAIFVKTPDFSPIKTRLAATIGLEAAKEFHLLSAKAVESVILKILKIKNIFTPYWAVAEKQALSSPYWKNFQTMWQGNGGLGARLSHIYEHLIQRHPFVIFVGADCPQLTEDIIEKSTCILSKAKETTFIIGTAQDGGFYLFGGNGPIPQEVWLKIPYSTSTTALTLTRELKCIGSVQQLPQFFDVDTMEDLEKLFKISTNHFTKEQKVLVEWARDCSKRGRVLLRPMRATKEMPLFQQSPHDKSLRSEKRTCK